MSRIGALVEGADGFAGVGEYAVDAVSGDLYRVESYLTGDILTEDAGGNKLTAHRLEAQLVRVDWTDDREPNCRVEFAGA